MAKAGSEAIGLEVDQDLHVPLDMESVFGWGTWMLIGIIVLFLALPFFLTALTQGEFALGVVASVGMLFGFYALRKMLHLLTKSLIISSDGICWRRGLRRRRLEWKDVQFYHYGLMVQKPPHHARFAVMSRAGKAYFETRVVWYENILARLERSCPQAFSMDYATGRIYPPRKNDMANFMPAEFKRIAWSKSRRFRMLAVAQIACLPICLVLAVAILAGPVFVIGWKLLPYGLSDIRANFSRARYAWQSYLTGGRMNPDTIGGATR